MILSIAVRLLIPDTAAVSARRALQAHGLTQLADLQREQCWSFDLGAIDVAEVALIAARLLATDVIVNQNKHRARWWSGPVEQAVKRGPPQGEQTAYLLVETRDHPDVPALQRLLTARLGFRGLRVVCHATLWRVVAASGADPLVVAKQAADRLLVNRHGQACSLLVMGPSPVGED